MDSLPNILIVDDSKENLFFLDEAIKSMNINLIQASSGIEALEKTKKTVLALAIIDVRMPGMSGYDLALRMNEERPEVKVPIIFVTANHMDEIEVFKGYGSGAVDYIFKPVDINILRCKINVFLALFNQKQIIIQKAAQLKHTTRELIKVNAELTKSEQKYRSYVDNAPDGVLVTDESGLIIDVNEAATWITGYSKKEFLNMSVLDLLPPESLEEGRNHFENNINTGVSKVFLLFKHKNETLRWCAIESVKLYDARFIHFLKDITQRKEIEEELKLQNITLELQNVEISQALDKVEISSKKYSELYDFAPSGYFTLSSDQTIQELNLSGAQMLGKERSHLVGINFGSFISKNTRLFFEAFFSRVFKSKAVEICEVKLEVDDSKPKFVYIEGMYIENSKQCLINVVDITERKIAEQALKISEEKYKTIMNASPDGIILIDLRGKIIEVSEIGLEIFGALTRENMVGKDFYQFVPTDEMKLVKEIVEKTINEGLAQNIELKIKKVNQILFASETSVTLIQDQNGAPLSFMVIIRDISQRKKIATKQFHADRMANLGEMASGIAHEINQPLNIISLVMDKILFKADKTESIDIAFIKNKSNKIFENIFRIRNIIDHVRAFSRSQNDYILAAFSINSSIENAVSMIMEQFKHLGISLDLQLEENIPQYLGNTYKFEQVIINLLVNAKDAVIEKKNLQEEYFQLTIGIRTYLENQCINVEVTDNGIGIGKDNIDNIMLPFFTTKEEGSGTGIGLSICYQIIKEMNGIIEITSDISYGTKIKIILDTQKQK